MRPGQICPRGTRRRLRIHPPRSRRRCGQHYRDYRGDVCLLKGQSARARGFGVACSVQPVGGGDDAVDSTLEQLRFWSALYTFALGYT